MKQKTPAQLELAKSRAAIAAATLQGDADRAEEFDRMSIEDYAAERGIEIVENPAPEVLALVNPNQKGDRRVMPRENPTEKIQRLEAELSEAYDLIDEMKAERQDAISTLAETYNVEIYDPEEDEEFEPEDEEEESEEES